MSFNGMNKVLTMLTIFMMAGLNLSCTSRTEDIPNTAVNTESASEKSISTITDPTAALAEGGRLLDENQTERAIEYLEHAVSLDPDLAEAHFKLGIAYSLLELQYEQEGVVVERPSNSNNARVRSRSEKSFERAVKAYEKWVDAHPEDDNAYYFLGRTYSKLMKDEEAEKAFKQAVKLKSEDTEYQTELGAILVKLAKYHEAIPPLKKAVELDPENVRAEELLEDAQAGRQRIDYVSKPEANKQMANKASNPNSNVAANSNANMAPKAANANTRPKADPTKKPTPSDFLQ
jgi:tetratricopeptide (TPR) repeat protein